MPSKSIGKRISDVKIGQKKVIVKFDNGDSLELFPNTFTEFKLFKGKILSSNEIREIKKRNGVEEAYQKALKLCLSKPCTEKMVKDKLEKLEVNESDIDFIIKELRKYSLLDDKAFIDEYIEIYEYKGYGYNRIKKELKDNGVKRADLDKISYNKVNEAKKAEKHLKRLEKKYKNENNFMKHKKINESLIRLGFSFEVAKDISNMVKDNTHEVELELLSKDFKALLKRYNNKYVGKEPYLKIVNALLSKGYKHSDIDLIKGEYIYEMD